MKKYFSFIIIVLIGILIYFLLIDKPKSYAIEYDLKGFHIVEKYNVDIGGYSVALTKNNLEYPFSLKHKYSKKRKIVSSINETKTDSNICVSVKLYDVGLSPVCYKDNVLYDSYLDDYKENTDVLKNINNYDIYSDKFIYYVWDGFGLTDLLSGEKYDFLKKESYDNLFSYSLNNKILIGNYDDDYKYNKLYIFDIEKNRYEIIELETPIDKDSYILGHYEDYIYIFDRKSSIEYELNINKGKLTKVSTSDGGYVYNCNKKVPYSLNELKYNEKKFNYCGLVNYSINNKLYKTYFEQKKEILISNNDILDIISFDDNGIFYISKSNLYYYSDSSKEVKLLSNFDWNFSYKNKVFVFNK